ncbi:tetratricopeptide repeat protein [Murinocardiopsis flavida]|uniref:Tetratricopeptide repeat protein n=1 Tax=Murinocardiopsis flavida TaxID=645275 RepID=A0A2P8CR68_9ACTN|nr:tetratricopeptide repeat protein [Murinocardiopsis flavida]PSK87464.1 tetratricopeptide repeat protein [Murinocardiopsis flavida]
MHLVGQPVPGRFGQHDLVRAFAADRALGGPDEADLDGARLRLVDYYLHTANLADRRLDPQRAHVDPEGPPDGCRPDTPADEGAAAAWLEREHRCLMAAQRMAADRGWDTRAWQLARVLDTFHWRQGRVGDHRAAWRIGLVAATRSGDLAAQTLAHRNLGQIHMQAREYAEGRHHLTEALALARRSGDRMTGAHIHLVLVRAHAEDGAPETGARHGEQALALYRELGAAGWEASARNQLGVLALQRGLLAQAREHCEAALALHRGQAGRSGEAETLDSLGSIAHARQDYEAAADYYHRALDLTRELGHAALQADALAGLGAACAAAGRSADAQRSWHKAAALYRAQQRTAEADEVGARLARLG